MVGPSSLSKLRYFCVLNVGASSRVGTPLPIVSERSETNNDQRDIPNREVKHIFRTFCLGVLGGVGTPLPIPNRVVKHTSTDDTQG